MARERSHLYRDSDIIEPEKIYILTFEGNITEEKYFRELIDNKMIPSNIHIHIIKRGKDDTRSAPIHVFNLLKDEIKEKYHLYPSDEFWMIVDVDRWKNLNKIVLMCNEEGNFFPAISNPCFEIWIAMHFVDINCLSPEVRRKLLENKKVPGGRKKYIDKYLQTLIPGGWNKNNPKPKRFMDRVDFAIGQGKEHDNTKDIIPKELGSQVYRIVEKLIS